MKNSRLGYTLAELLIALGILGVIAVFVIPKLLAIRSNQSYNSSAKEAAATISGAYQVYKSKYAVTSNTSGGD
jgi:prepilin-type N-terminal cleavage/methylation domain-containing protein